MEEKRNMLDRIQNYLDTEKGRVLLNYLYSWGAAVVILGALFKLTHIAGANLMLFLGMGTEVIVFFISGFEKPFIPDKGENAESEEVQDGAIRGNIYINGSIPAGEFQPAAVQPAVGQPVTLTSGGGQLDVDGVEGVTQNYINQVRELTEKLIKVSQQSDLLQQSTSEIDELGRNLVSLNKFYEMHLRSVSSQMDNIDKVKNQTAEMVSQIEELNRIYARMVEALKVNSAIGSATK